MDQVGGADESEKNPLMFSRAACSVKRFLIFMEWKRIFKMTVNSYRFTLLQVIRKWLVVIFTAAFWGAESKSVRKKKPCAV